MNIRTFIALEISNEARDELSRIIGELKKTDADVKWVHPESVHLTLKFLGATPEEKIQSIGEKLKIIASKTPPFEIVMTGIGVFPNWNYVKVIWVGVEKGSDKLKDLALQVDNAMSQEGFEKEKRPFSSHLTLGRVRSPKNKDKLERMSTSIQVNPVTIPASKIILFKSDLTPKGSIYTPLYTAHLTSSSC